MSISFPPPPPPLSLSLFLSLSLWQYLMEQSDFLVVGAIGRQGVGKSSVMSLLAGSRTGSGKPAVFRPETKEVWENESYQTTGLDMAVTPERVILLDTQVGVCV